MAGFSAENSFVGEDWDSECYDSAPCYPVMQNSGACRPVEYGSSERDDISERKPGLTSFADVNLQLHDSADKCMASVVTDFDNLTTSAGDAADDKSAAAFVTDSKKVFVTNVSYRVCLFVYLYVFVVV